MRTPRHALTAALLLAALALSACGSTAKTSIPASGRLVSIPGSTTGEIVLTQVGADRIGIQTTTVVRSVSARHPTVTIPYSSLVYAPDGSTYAFTAKSPLVFTEVPVTVDHIQGDSVVLANGPKAGSRVVAVGAEELLGVQTGVLEQT